MASTTRTTVPAQYGYFDSTLGQIGPGLAGLQKQDKNCFNGPAGLFCKQAQQAASEINTFMPASGGLIISPVAEAFHFKKIEAHFMDSMFENRTDLTGLSQAVASIRRTVGEIVIGQSQMVDLMIAGLLSDGHLLIEGVPGVAKTLTAKLLARSMDVPFSRLQFTPDLMPSDVLGTSVFNPREGQFVFQHGPIFSSIVLIDEINRAPAKTQSALFEVMEERQVTVDGMTYPMADPFMVIATQNPVEQEGTYRLPEAQLDRFLFKINVGYPSVSEEVEILNRQQHASTTEMLNDVQPVLTAANLAELRHVVKAMVVEPRLLEFIANIVAGTRNNSFLYLGASPRASLAILKSAKALAAIRGRDFVVPEDITYVVPHVLRHRIILSPEKEMEGITADDMVRQLLEKVEVPR
jgi:MoxR-like ATPase